MSKKRLDLVIRHIDRLVTMEPGEPVIESAAVGISDGKIAWVGKDDAVEKECDVTGADTLDGKGKLALPGLIDCHTHFLFGGFRQNEFVRRIQGQTYQEIAAAGGGIRASVKATRSEPDDVLKAKGKKRLDEYLSQGVTTVEGKSGYALDTDHELRTLRIMRDLNGEHPVSVIPTFLGAHWVPEEFHDDRAGFLDKVCHEMIPLVAEKNLAQFCDVFCDVGAFDVAESERVLRAGMDHGLRPKIHTDEFESIGGAELAARVRAISADHLCRLTEKGIDTLAEAAVVGVLLPGTTFFLRSDRYAPAQKMIERGMTVALATDFNPGSNTCQNLLLTGTIACLQMGLTPHQALAAITLGAAKAIGLENEIGSLKVGKKADVVLFDAPDEDYLFYSYGTNHVECVIKDGKKVYSRHPIRSDS